MTEGTDKAPAAIEDASAANKKRLAERGPAPDFAADSEAYKAYVARLKDRRKPFGAFQQKLAYPARPGYYRYWFNDEPGRINEARDAGYEHVKDPHDKQHVKRVVGTRKEGGALWAYLMEIPTEIWELDLAANNKRTDDIERAIRQSKVIVNSGADPKEDAGGFYVPGGGSTVEGGIGSRRR